MSSIEDGLECYQLRMVSNNINSIGIVSNVIN